MQKVFIDIPTQTLYLSEENNLIVKFPISTSKFGVGEACGSNCTPRGKHLVRAKIGANKPIGTVFVERRPTGEIYSPLLAKQYPGRDWILTRILWLSGCERGSNRLGGVDTMRRYIYIHGTSEEDKIGTPASGGCIRMRNQEVITLFDQVSIGTLVFIS